MSKAVRKILLAISILLFAAKEVSAAKYLEIEPSQFSKNNQVVIEIWNSKEGLIKLNDSQFKNDFYGLANFFQPQINPFYCGIATSVIILNAFNAPQIVKTGDKSIAADLLTGKATDYLTYNQEDLLNEKTDKIKDRKIIEFKNVSDKEEFHDPGLNLKDLAALLDLYGLKTKITYATHVDKKAIDEFRELVKKVVSDDKSFLIVNFDTRSIGFQTLGHHSPLVAYDEKSDSVLIMDVSYKRPWFWVPIPDLYEAMHTKDGNKYRGYLVVTH